MLQGRVSHTVRKVDPIRRGLKPLSSRSAFLASKAGQKGRPDKKGIETEHRVLLL